MDAKVKIGLFGTGLHTYWGQFDGLLDELNGYRTRIRSRMERTPQIEVVDGGMVDSPERALEAAALFAEQRVDLVFLYMATYCLSSTILPVVERIGCPIVVLNLQPAAAIDYEKLNALGDRGRMTGMWLANCQACSAPEIASVMKRSGHRCTFVTGYLDDPTAWRQIEAWLAAARVWHGMRNNRLGILGHYYCGMLDVYTDLTRQSAVFGTLTKLKRRLKPVIDIGFPGNWKTLTGCNAFMSVNSKEVVTVEKIKPSKKLSKRKTAIQEFKAKIDISKLRVASGPLLSPSVEAEIDTKQKEVRFRHRDILVNAA